MPCDEGKCFVPLRRGDRRVKFPAYWRTKDAEHVNLLKNPFMTDRLQTLIRESVRPRCGSGCRGRDGDGTGTKSAVVTKVIRIENGPLWQQYWERKQKMLKGTKEAKYKKLAAKSMDRFRDIFSMVQVCDQVNELFLFHGTGEQSAKSIAKSGFDPSRCSGLYGAGTYCADYSCKSMQYTQSTDGGERVFIICRVLMGHAYHTDKTLRAHKEPPEYKDGRLYESVFAEEGRANKKIQKHNEYITYSKDQVYPEYLVYMKLAAS